MQFPNYSPASWVPFCQKVLIVSQQILGDLAFGDSFGCLESNILHVSGPPLFRASSLLTRAAMDRQHFPLCQRWRLLPNGETFPIPDL